MDASKLRTSYDATGQHAAHKVNCTEGINVSPVAQRCYDFLEAKGTAGEVADDRRKAHRCLFQWIDVQLPRIVFKDCREDLPQRFKNLL